MNFARAILANGESVEYFADDPIPGVAEEAYFTADRRSVVCFRDADLAAGPTESAARRRDWERLLGPCNPTLERSRGGGASNEAEAAFYRSLFRWPTAIVVQPRFGLLAPRDPDRFVFRSGFPGEPKEAIRFCDWKSRRFLERRAPEELGAWPGCFKACLRLATAVRRLRELGLSHPNLSPENVLIDPISGRVLVLGVESLTFADRDRSNSPSDPGGRRSVISANSHALASLIHRLLLRRTALGSRLNDLLRRAFADAHAHADAVPSAADWERGLLETSDWLSPCPEASCATGWLVADPIHPLSWSCLDCGTKLAKAPLFLRLRRQDQDREGRWLPERDIAVRDGLTLRDPRFRDSGLDLDLDDGGPEPLAVVERLQRRWLLRNLGRSSFWTFEGVRVPPQGSIELKENLGFVLSDDPAARAIEVRRGPID